ncbi:MAG: aminodeoxychorismate/anthranilate synthase component II [Deltaproteobacteria bacterium]|nr:aminodeoxychorismate/anthranilate synthase component II [Deltaproteobacteria bacterium]
MRCFLLDNRDSFTFNLAQAFHALGGEVMVQRAESRMPAAMACLIHEWSPTHLVLSPGPLRPEDHPMNAALLDRFAGRIPILGVCLGMQAINLWCGGTLRRDTPPMHGKTSLVRYTEGAPLMEGLPNPFTAARYHSLVLDRLGRDLAATAWTGEVIMAVRHARHPIFGVQFHPESYMTPEGTWLLRNFLTLSLRGT